MRRWLGPVLSVLAVMAMFAVSTQQVRADPRDFTLVNGSQVTIAYVYVSPADAQSWEEDVLGSDVLRPGQSVDITFSGAFVGNCVYDIKVIGSNGAEGFLYAVDLCSTGTVTFR